MMECQTLIKDDRSKNSENSNISSNDGHNKGTMLDLKSLALGQLLWAKGFQCSWWPAQVVDASTISESIIVNERIEGGVLVRFYGSYTYAWVDPLADLCDFRESFNGKGSSHEKAFQKSLEEILLHNKLNKPSVQVDEMSEQLAIPSQRNKSGGEKPAVNVSICKSAKGKDPEQTRSQGKLKEKDPKASNLEQPDQIQSQRKQKVPKRAKVDEPEKIQSQLKRKEKVPKNVEVERAEQIQSLGKMKLKIPNIAKDEKSEQIQSQGKEEKSPKRARGEDPKQIESQGKRNKNAPKSARGEEPVQIQSQEKRKGKAPKSVKGEKLEKIHGQEKGKEKTPECAKDEEPKQTQTQRKKKEKAPSNLTPRSQGKRKDKEPSNAQEVVEDGSVKMVRQIRVLRQLGLAAPAGSPFSVDCSIKTTP